MRQHLGPCRQPPSAHEHVDYEARYLCKEIRSRGCAECWGCSSKGKARLEDDEKQEQVEVAFREGGDVALSAEDAHSALPVRAWQVDQRLARVFIATVGPRYTSFSLIFIGTGTM